MSVLSKIVSVVLVVGMMSFTACNNLFFYPLKRHILEPGDFELEYQDLKIKTPDGLNLHGWKLAAESSPDAPPKARVLFLHGNAENISTHIQSVYWLPAEGYEVWLVDYRGYGKSEGSADRKGVHADVRTALRSFLEYRDDATLESASEVPKVVFGQSLGGAIAMEVLAGATERLQLCALVVDSSFSGYRAIAQDKLASTWLTWPLQIPLSYLVSDEMSARDVVAGISPLPLLLVHSRADEIVPVHHSEELFSLAAEPKELWISEEFPHIATFSSEQWRERLLDYLARHCAS